MMIRPGVDMMEALRLRRAQVVWKRRWPCCAAAPGRRCRIRQEGSGQRDGARARHGAPLSGDRQCLDGAVNPRGLRRNATRRRCLAANIDARRISGSLAQVRPSGRMGACSRRAEAGKSCFPPGATFETGDFANEAGSRRYKLYVPSCYRGEPLPRW